MTSCLKALHDSADSWKEHLQLRGFAHLSQGCVRKAVGSLLC